MNKSISTADLRRSVETVEAELQEAREAYAKAAYASALDRNDEVSRKALIAAKQRMDLLTAELQGLSAAMGEARRREDADVVQAEIRETEEQRIDSLAAVESVRPAFERMQAAIVELGEARTELNLALRNAAKAERVCAPSTGHMNMTSFDFSVEAMVRGLLWLAVRDELTANRSDITEDVAGRPTPERVIPELEKLTDRARSQINTFIDQRLRSLRG